MNKAISTYVILFFLYSVTSVELLNTFGNVAALLIFIISAYYAVRSKLGLYYTLYGSLVILAALVVYGYDSLSETIKYASIFVIYYAGLQSKIPITNSVRITIIAIPIIALLYDIASGQYSHTFNSGLFINKNNSALFFIIVSVLLSSKVRYSTTVIFYHYVVALLFATVGAFLSTVISYYVSLRVKYKFRYAFLSLLFITFIFTAGSSLEIVKRFQVTISGVQTLFSNNSDTQYISQLTYGEAVALSGSSDLSYLFRLKHWIEIIDILKNRDIINTMLGTNGIYDYYTLTTMPLLPHNDYLRIISSHGIVGLVIFSLFMLRVYANAGFNRFYIVFFLVYMLTENIMDNFYAIVILFYCLGLQASEAKIFNATNSGLEKI